MKFLNSNKTLIEITVSIAVLFIAAAFTVYMFVQAGNAQNRARDLDRAVLAAQTVIEDYKTGAEPSLVINLCKEFRECGAYMPDGFCITTEICEEGKGCYAVTVTVIKNKPYFLDRSDEIIFSLETVVYKQ